MRVTDRQTKPPAADRGLTLLELAVAVLVLSIGSLAALRATDHARDSIGAGRARLLSEVVARNRAEELRFLGGAGRALPGSVEIGGLAFTVQTDFEATAEGLTRVTVIAQAQQAPSGGAMLVTYLPRRR